VKITPGSCPHCGVINREAETMIGREGGPQPGDAMICETCADFSIYVGHGAARKPEPYERASMLEDVELAKAIFEAQMDLL
jgi:hypothetical protein